MPDFIGRQQIPWTRLGQARLRNRFQRRNQTLRLARFGQPVQGSGAAEPLRAATAAAAKKATGEAAGAWRRRNRLTSSNSAVEWFSELTLLKLRGLSAELRSNRRPEPFSPNKPDGFPAGGNSRGERESSLAIFSMTGER
jgi:hypothetical protein